MLNGISFDVPPGTTLVSRPARAYSLLLSSLPVLGLSRPTRCTMHWGEMGRCLQGVVGASGCGKSTIFKLLYRFYDVEAGRILVDGNDVT